ncbi:MAG: TIGR03086 family metal-binding protein [Actinomycetota bacterium]|nr:TIGR03086 family metal-binding protein [Actinomycetota bacterium]
MTSTDTTRPDLAPAASAVAAVVAGIRDDQLAAPTPCPDMTVAALLDHLHGLAWAFTVAAEKSPDSATSAAQADADALVPAWREEIPARLDALARAWAEPDAWTGMTAAGGVELPGEVAGTVALDEIVLHGWDLAVATGQTFRPDDASVEVVYGFTAAMSAPGQEAGREGLFGPVVPVPEDAPAFERALGFAGRDPRWTP